VRKLWVLILGWALVLIAIPVLPLPGPGLLMLVAGLTILSLEYEWARRRLEPVRARAQQAARQSVQTTMQITLSCIPALFLIGVGVAWGLQVRIPKLGPVGPELPFAGWGTGSSLIFSGLVALTLLVVSVYRYRPRPGQGSESPADSTAPAAPEAGGAHRVPRLGNTPGS
jgi:uncharacterized protein (TIGR02611 family)